MKKKIFQVIIIIFFYMILCTFGRFISIGGIKPNLLIIFPVIFGFLGGKKEGMWTGLFSGFLYEIMFNDVIGFTPMVFMHIGYVSGYFYQKYEESEMLFPLIFVMAGDTAFEILAYVGNFLLHNKLDFPFYMSRIIIPEVVYTLFITIILYKPMVFLYTWFGKKRKRRVRNFDEGDIR